MIKKHFRFSWPLLLSFFVPATFMLLYFISRGMAPFGKSSLLTVDMGQQYIDFYAFFRNTILHHPGSFFYSFSKALGGETTSLWAYYLLSPFNFILLPFSRGGLSAAVLLITVLKYGCAGLSIAWVLKQLKLQTSWRLPIFATAYAMNGWMVANQLNLMWLDAVILLPLVIYGVEQLITKQHFLPYIGWLAAALIINYYMAYMICLFMLLYVPFSLVWHRHDFLQTVRRIAWVAVGSLLAGGIAAVVLIPTFSALQLSKASYTLTKFSWKFDYLPFKMLGKLFPGSFNFAQMPKGQPNIFVGALFFLLVINFFWQRSVSSAVKITVSVLTFILLLSVCFTPLNLLWHAGQFPIWYPYRFSYILCFWFIWLAAIGWQKQVTLTKAPLITFVALLTGVVIYLAFTQSSLDFMTTGQLVTGTCLALIACLLVTPVDNEVLANLRLSLLLLLTIADLGINAVMSLDKISYVPQKEFSVYTSVLDRASGATKKADHDFYRIGTTFQRTKGDPLQADFFGGAHFGSTLERKTTGFYDLTGNPDGDGFVTYSNGTPMMDALLNFKYFWSVNSLPSQGATSQAKYIPILTQKPDLKAYNVTNILPQTTVHQNPNTLGPGFMAAKSITKVQSLIHDPISNQNVLWNGLLGLPENNKLFSAVNFSDVTPVNVNNLTNITGAMVTRKNKQQPAEMTLHFIPQTDNSYYLSLGANMQKDNVTILLNGQRLAQYPTFRNTVLVNLASQQKDEPQAITFKLKKNDLWLQNVTLYQMPQQSFDTGIKQLKQHPWKITDWGQTHLSGSVTATKKQPVLMTSIPAQPGWQAVVDGKTAATKTVADQFIAIPLKPGKHQIALRYHTPKLGIGIFISCLSLIATAGLCLWTNKQRPRNKFKF